jgi:hypothetical protein
MIGTYYFDQFNIKVEVHPYTDEEYEQLLQGTIRCDLAHTRSRLDKGGDGLSMVSLC